MRKNIPTLILSIALLCPVLSVYAWGMTRTPEDRGPSSNISYTDAFSAFRGRACRETPGGEHSRGEAGIGLFASDKGLFGACAGDEGTLPVVPVVVNDSVESFLKYFQTTGRKHFERWLARAEGYDALVKSILRQEGLPEDLFYIAFIESGLNPKARSNRDAVGMWQFIKPTAVRYGLRVDWWVDERMDPEKATLAAAGYFKSLYERFGSWYLAAAGYNAGEGSVMRAIKRHDSTDFWELAKHKGILGRETRQYVPKYLAAMLIAKDPERYGFYELEYSGAVSYDKVTIPHVTDLRVIASSAGITVEDVQSLNPELLRWFTPPGYDNYELKLPAGTLERFNENFAKIPPPERVRFQRHRVKPGDTLWGIAKRYGTSVKPILYLNDLKNPKSIKPGNIIIVPVRAEKGLDVVLVSWALHG